MSTDLFEELSERTRLGNAATAKKIRERDTELAGELDATRLAAERDAENDMIVYRLHQQQHLDATGRLQEQRSQTSAILGRTPLVTSVAAQGLPVIAGQQQPPAPAPAPAAPAVVQNQTNYGAVPWATANHPRWSNTQFILAFVLLLVGLYAASWAYPFMWFKLIDTGWFVLLAIVTFIVFGAVGFYLGGWIGYKIDNRRRPAHAPASAPAPAPAPVGTQTAVFPQPLVQVPAPSAAPAPASGAHAA